MVCSAGFANGQIQGIPVEDPTIENPTYCAYHIIPTNNNAQHEGIPDQTPFKWLYNPPIYGFPIYSSWLDASPTWVPDRRPMMSVQLASDGWTQNSRGLTSKWWITSTYFEGGRARLHADESIDQHSPNLPATGGAFNSDDEWLMNGGVPATAPNGVPDQFDALIRTILRWREQGVRRVMLHLPAGVTAGKLVGFDYNPNGAPYFNGPHQGRSDHRICEGTTQSMNQFLGLPSWKQSYFLGQNAWRDFLNTYCDPQNNADSMDIEVYIGGGIPIGSAGVTTERTDLNGTSVNDPDPGISEDRLESFTGRYNEFHEPLHENCWREWNRVTVPPVPIDPRYEFYSWNPTYNIMETRHGNMNHVWNVISPWFSSGIKRIWFDTASENFVAANSGDYGHERRWGALEFAHNPWVRSNGIRIGGETIPTIDLANNQEILDDCAVGHMPWLANFQMVSYPDSQGNGHRTWKPYALTTLSHETTEVHLLDNTDHMEWEDFQYAREHNYIVGAWNAYGSNPKTAEMMKRWYSIGSFKVADFNGDGVINGTDLTMANDAIGRAELFTDNDLAHRQIFPAVFANGDIDGNGTINESDRILFVDTYWHQHELGNDMIVNFIVVGTEHANHDY